MRKIVILALAFVLGTSFVGCGKKNKSAQINQSVQISQSAQAKTAKQSARTIKILYGSSMSQSQVDALNECIANEVMKTMSEEERCYLGCSGEKKMAVRHHASNVKKKLLPTSAEMTRARAICAAKF